MKKTALGLGVAVTAIITLIIQWLLVDNTLFVRNKLWITIVLGIMGLLTLAPGMVRPWLRRLREGDTPAKPLSRETFPLLSPSFWGVQMLLCAVLVQVIVSNSELVQMVGKSQVVASIKHRLSRIQTAPPPHEPGLRLQGLMIEPQANRASAIINGQLVGVGDELNGTKVMAIHRRGVDLQNTQGVTMLQIPDGRDIKTNSPVR